MKYFSGYCSRHRFGEDRSCSVCWINHDHSELPTYAEAGFDGPVNNLVVCPICFPNLYKDYQPFPIKYYKEQWLEGSQEYVVG